MSRTNKHFPDQFKRQAVELARACGRPVGQIARELGVADQSLGNWMAQVDGSRGKSELTSDEREELKFLRKEIKTLRMEREILKKAPSASARRRNTPIGESKLKELGWQADGSSIRQANAVSFGNAESRGSNHRKHCPRPSGIPKRHQQVGSFIKLALPGT